MTTAGVPSARGAVLHFDRWTEPFWRAAAEHRLVCARCVVCARFRMPPTPFCWACSSQETEWVDLSGNGVVYSFTVVRRPIVPELADAVPYVVAVVELEGANGARLITNLVDVEIEQVEVGMEVLVAWHATSEGFAIPRFTPSVRSE